MIVTLEIFSGRPNPTWTLAEDDQRRLFDRVQGRSLAPAEVPETLLGFRGLVVQPGEGDVVEIPQSFRIAGIGPVIETERTKGARALSVDESNDAAQFLLQSARTVIPDDLQQLVVDERKRQAAELLPTGPPIPDPPDPAPPCQVVANAYNPSAWNSAPTVYMNNCYNYGMNKQTNTFAQPGRAHGKMYTALTCADVGTAASQDGCTTTCKAASHRVALVVWPGWDFHWYRKHSNGFWAHKPGSTPARNTDNSNRVINGTSLTPANCDRGPYSAFCGYRYAPKTMVIS